MSFFCFPHKHEAKCCKRETRQVLERASFKVNNLLYARLYPAFPLPLSIPPYLPLPLPYPPTPSLPLVRYGALPSPPPHFIREQDHSEFNPSPVPRLASIGFGVTRHDRDPAYPSPSPLSP